MASMTLLTTRTQLTGLSLLLPLIHLQVWDLCFPLTANRPDGPTRALRCQYDSSYRTLGEWIVRRIYTKACML